MFIQIFWAQDTFKLRKGQVKFRIRWEHPGTETIKEGKQFFCYPY